MLRLYRFLAEKDPKTALQAVETIESAFVTLSDLPMVGKKKTGNLRELNIAFGRSGYVALFHYDTDLDTVIILAIRHQREKDYK